MAQTELRAWTVKDSLELYNVNGWGRDFFTINEAGNVEVTPAGNGSPRIDLMTQVDDLRSRGLRLPLLIRFSDILRRRVEQLCGSFQQAIAENDYKGTYRGVYPIKVNQQRHVVEELVEYGRPFNLGLEAGSKAFRADVNPTSRIRACKPRNLLQIKAPLLKVCTTRLIWPLLGRQ